MLLPGDCVPFFDAASTVNKRFSFDTAAGRYVVLSFFGSTRLPVAEAFLNRIVEQANRFDVTHCIFFGVTNDPADAQNLSHRDNGRIYFFDFDLAISKKFGLVREAENVIGDEAGQKKFHLSPTTFVLDQSLRVVAVIGMGDRPDESADAVFNVLDSLPKLNELQNLPPVLIVPYVFEPDMCKTLIDYYECNGGEDSGFMNDVNGKTVGVIDYTHKRRMDCEITDQSLIRATQERIKRRIVPAIAQAFQFNVTRIERHIVACYDAEQGAHFRAHRDNTTLGTAHRRFAITINLNSPEYEGGEIWFPEFGPRRYKASSGSAIVFSCSLLHEVPKVTRGKRYAFLPFLYDDAAAAVRERNRWHLGNLKSAGVTSNVCQDAPTTQPQNTKPLIDGTCGCGNPAGCGTCLNAAAYSLGSRQKQESDAGVQPR